MRWIMFFILLYILSALQVTQFLAFPSGDRHWPALMYLPLLAVFYSLFAEDPASPLAALICGLMMDLLSGPGILIGTNMIPLGLTALLVARTRAAIFREQMFAQAIMTLLALMLFAALSTFFRILIGSPQLEGQSLWIHFATLLLNATYTALAAPFIFWTFFRFPQMLGFTPQRRRERR